MPVFCKQIKECILWRMFCDKRLIEGHAEPWSVRQREATIRGIDLDHARDGFLHPGISKVIKMLLNLEVGCARRNVKSRGGPHRPTHVVWRHKHVISICP